MTTVREYSKNKKNGNSIVLHGDPGFPPPKGHSPQFSAHICCGQKAAWIKMPFGMKVGLGQGHIVLDGDRASIPKKEGHSPPIFSAHVHCGQTAGWIKMPLCTMIGLSPPTLCYMWPQHYPQGEQPPISAHVCCGQTAGWIKVPRWALAQATLCYIGTQLPLPKWAPPPIFGPCLLWPNGCPSQPLLSTCIICPVLYAIAVGQIIKETKVKLEAKDVLPNINRTQATERAEKCIFVAGEW